MRRKRHPDPPFKDTKGAHVFRDDTDASITSLFRKGYDAPRIAKMLGLTEVRVLRLTRALEMQKKAHPETFARTTADTEIVAGVPLKGPAARDEDEEDEA